MRAFFHTHTEDGREWRIALVDTGDGSDFDGTADSLYSEYPRQLASTDVLIVRPAVDEQRGGFDTGGDLAKFLDRAPRASLHLLSSRAFQISLSESLNLNVPTPSIVSDSFLTALRRAELRSFIDQSSALFAARDNFVYRSPSGSYSRAFLRVGNIQTSIEVLDAFFFWMLPFVKDRNAVLVETWSISSIALNLAYRLGRYAPDRSEFRVEMLSAYHDGEPGLTRSATALLRRLTAGGNRALVVISVVATGTSLVRLRETVAGLFLPDDVCEFLALYRLTPDVALPTVCDLSEDSDLAEKVRHIEPPAGPAAPAVIDIDRHTYFPLHIRDTPVPIVVAATQPARPFFDRYKGTGALVVHHDTVDINGLPLRHHGIDVDVDALLRIPDFCRSIVRRLHDELPAAPKLVITPPHRAGFTIARIATAAIRERFGVGSEHIVHVDLHPLASDCPREKIAGLTGEDLILVADDVSLTGNRLSMYQKNLRDLGYEGRIVYFVTVARPPSERQWARRERDLRFREKKRSEPHQVLWVEKVILPDWDATTCPWCLERDALTILSKRPGLGASEEMMLTRLSTLFTSVQDGLVRNVFWCGDTRPYMTCNSIFLDHEGATEADVVAAVAGAIQRMRVGEGGHSLEASYPHVTVIDESDYLGTTFTDAILRLAILRVAYARELERWSDTAEQRRRDLTRQLLLTPDALCDTLCLESLLAMLHRKLPRPRFDPDEWSVIDRRVYGPLARLIVEG